MKQRDIKNSSNQRHCPKCGNDEFYRCKRNSHLEKLVSFVGLFPYLCHHYSCRKKSLIFSTQDYFKIYDRKSFFLTLLTFFFIFLSFVGLVRAIQSNQLTRLLAFGSYFNEGIHSDNGKLLEYQNFEEGIQLKYSEYWERQELPDPLTGEIVTFISPKESDFDTFREKVFITVELLSKTDTSLDEYKNSSYTEIQKFLKNSIIIESSITTLGNIPAYKIIYSGKDSNSNWIANMEVLTVKNNQAYRITYTADSSNYNKFLINAEEIINSFKFLK
ncbi:MAG TPA: hypothetical protein V6D15_25070 [Oculatellaceae cyanobacterium]|jgi:hypothetical protein